MAVWTMDDTFQRFQSDYAPAMSRLTLTPREQAGAARFTLGCTRPDPDHVLLRGDLHGKAIEVGLRRIEEPRSLLRGWRIHWIRQTTLNL